MISTDFECLIGKVLRGDITPYVYELIKDSAFIDDIFSLGTVKRRERNVRENGIPGHADEVSSRGTSFENWLSESVQSITIPRDGEDTECEQICEPEESTRPW